MANSEKLWTALEHQGAVVDEHVMLWKVMFDQCPPCEQDRGVSHLSETWPDIAEEIEQRLRQRPDLVTLAIVSRISMPKSEWERNYEEVPPKEPAPITDDVPF